MTLRHNTAMKAIAVFKQYIFKTVFKPTIVTLDAN